MHKIKAQPISYFQANNCLYKEVKLCENILLFIYCMIDCLVVTRQTDRQRENEMQQTTDNFERSNLRQRHEKLKLEAQLCR